MPSAKPPFRLGAWRGEDPGHGRPRRVTEGNPPLQLPLVCGGQGRSRADLLQAADLLLGLPVVAAVLWYLEFLY